MEETVILQPELVKYLRFTLSIDTTSDPVLKKVTDAELEEVLKRKAQHLKYDYDNIPKDEEQLVICLARKEIYWKMATNSAPLYRLDIEGLEVAKEVRFDHYMALVQETDVEYYKLINDPSRLTVEQGEILVRKQYAMDKYLLNYKMPKITLHVDKATQSTLDISIEYKNLILHDFREAKLYVCTEPIWDKYDEVINPKAKEVCVFKTPKKPYCRVKDLEVGTKYYLALEVVLIRNIKVYVEIEGGTLDA